MTKTLFEFENVNVLRQDGSSLLSDINLSLKPGEFVGLVGPNGSGKTTLALAALGLFPKTSPFQFEGRAFFNGQDLWESSREEKQRIRGKEISFIFQDPSQALNPLRRVGGHLVEVILNHQDLSHEDALLHAESCLQKVHLSKQYLKRYPFQLSGGEAQRVMIAMSIANNPSLIIADEPTTSLDTEVQEEIMTLLQSLQKKMGLSVLFISHDHELVQRFAQRTVCLEQGALRSFHSTVKKQPVKRPAACEKTKPLLVAENVRVQFPLKKDHWLQKQRYHTAVQGGTLSIHEGEILGICGPNGSGKTTLVRALLQLIPMQGHVSFQGRDLSQLTGKPLRKIRKDMQIVFQNPIRSLNPKFTIQEIIEEGLVVHFPRVSPKKRLEKVLDILKEVDLSPSYLERHPEELSGGEVQRVAIARAMILNPALLILDEPTASLDHRGVENLKNLIQRLNQERGAAFIIISHEENFLQSLAYRDLRMKEGCLHALGE